MLPHRSDTSRGHLHPPTRSHLTLPPALPFSLSLSFSLVFSLSPVKLRLDLTPHHQGGFSRAAAYAATFLGALARVFLPLSDSTTSLQLPGPPRNLSSFSPSPPPLRRTARRCNGHCLRVKSFHPQAERHSVRSERSGRLHDFWDFRSYDREHLRRCA